MKIREIRKGSVEVVVNTSENTVVASYRDDKGSYFLNQQLKKEYFLNNKGEFIGDATYYEATFCGNCGNIKTNFEREYTCPKCDNGSDLNW